MAPLFVVVDRSGNEIEGAYEKLDVLQGRLDRFSLAGFDFAARFYPDYVLVDGKPATRTQEFKNPTFTIEVEQDGKKVTEATMPKNGVIEFAGYRLEMRNLLYWVRFYIIKERGLAILYTGFAMATIAVIWRLLLYRREIIGAVRNEDGRERLVVAARAEFYKNLAEDEFSKLFNGLVGISDEHQV
jgi:hypothetical protein